MPNPPVPALLKQFSREMRRAPTPHEAIMWRALRGKQIAHVRFKRQFVVGAYILDFYCHAHKLAVELDGGQHATIAAKQADERRTAYLNQQGIRVLRFWNNDVSENLEGVLEVIFAVCQEPPPQPLPRRGGAKTAHCLEPSPLWGGQGGGLGIKIPHA